METKAVPFDGSRVLPSETFPVLEREGLREMQESPLRVEEVGQFAIASRIVRKRSRFLRSKLVFSMGPMFSS